MATAARVNRSSHTFITGLAESGEASDETIRQIAGHVSKQTMKHYSHIGMEAKRRAVDSLVKKAPAVDQPQVSNGVVIEYVIVSTVN